jgi:hypothetical protein
MAVSAGVLASNWAISTEEITPDNYAVVEGEVPRACTACCGSKFPRRHSAAGGTLSLRGTTRRGTGSGPVIAIFRG